MIGRETINIPEIFSGVHGFTGKTVNNVFYCEAFTAVKIYPELQKASHSFAEEKSRTTNDKQLSGVHGFTGKTVNNVFSKSAIR